MLMMQRQARLFLKTLIFSALAFPTNAETLPGLQDCVSVSSGDYVYMRDYDAADPTRDCKAAPSLISTYTSSVSAAGSDRSIQFNNASALGGSSTFVYTNTDRVGLGTGSPNSRYNMQISGPGDIALGAIKDSDFWGIEVGESSTKVGGFYWRNALERVEFATYGYAYPIVFGNDWLTLATSGNVGVGATSPGAQLQVNAGAAATKGLIVKGASSQSANLQEWQTNAGTAVTIVDSAGIPTLRKDITSGNQYYDAMYVANQGAFKVWPTQKLVTFGGRTADNRVDLYGGSQYGDGAQFTVYGASYSTDTSRQGAAEFMVKSGQRFGLFEYDGILENLAVFKKDGVVIGRGSYFAQPTPNAQLDVTARTASTIGTIVKGATSQTANLQEWQNSSGTVMANVSSAGNFTLADDKFLGLSTTGARIIFDDQTIDTVNFASANIGINAAPSQSIRLLANEAKTTSTGYTPFRFQNASTVSSSFGATNKTLDLNTTFAGSLTNDFSLGSAYAFYSNTTDTTTIPSSDTLYDTGTLNFIHNAQANTIAAFSGINQYGVNFQVGLSGTAPSINTDASFRQTSMTATVTGNLGTTGTTEKTGVALSVLGTADTSKAIDIVGVASATTLYGIYMTETGTSVKHKLTNDSQKTYFGTGEDAAIYYTGTNWVFDAEKATNAYVFNSSGNNTDFNIEGDTDPNTFYLDASADRIGIGTNAPSAQLHTTGTVMMTGLPTADPGISGALWNNAGTLKISP